MATMAELVAGPAGSSVRQAYKDYLGRDASDDEIASHLGGRNPNAAYAARSIRDSEEAQAYALQRQNAAGAGGGVSRPQVQDPYGRSPSHPDYGKDPNAPSGPKTGGYQPGVSTDARFTGTPYTDRGSGSGANRDIYSGFDFGQDEKNRLIGKSAKYTLANGTKLAFDAGADDSWKTKAGAEGWAKQWLVPYLEQNGVQVLDVIGEKIFMRDHEDVAAGRPGSWVDWVIGADGDDPKIGFQVEQNREAFGALDPQYGEAYVPTQGPAIDPVTGQPVGGINEFAYRNLAQRPGYQGPTARDWIYPDAGLPPQENV